ncbi:MAG: amidohydrolase family protein, partial [Victivallaceae bacterium]|nr:amidohydrolase family protein [Victivallaceae bacterium]
MKLFGNVVTPDRSGYGYVAWNGDLITEVSVTGEVKPEENWILPGFIDVHTHGSGEFNVEQGARGVLGMAEFNATKGTTRFLPTYSSAPHEEILEFVGVVAEIVESGNAGSVVAGSHVEGPWLNLKFCGGMIPEMLRVPAPDEAMQYIEAGKGSFRMMTIAPEMPNAPEVIRLLHDHGVVVSSGHSACPPEFLSSAVESGLSEICHLFDSYDLPEDRGGVRQPALTDMAIIDDRLMKEIIMDGLHVPPELVILTRRAAGADHIIGITDSLQGAGLKEGRFLDCGKPYVIREGELARRIEDNQIIGSS